MRGDGASVELAMRSEFWSIPDLSGVGSMLRQLRIAAGLTQESLAEQAGVGVRSIQAIERGERRPRPETIRQLSDALHLSGAARTRVEAVARPSPRQRAFPGSIGRLLQPPIELKTGSVRR